MYVCVLIYYYLFMEKYKKAQKKYKFGDKWPQVSGGLLMQMVVAERISEISRWWLFITLQQIGHLSRDKFEQKLYEIKAFLVLELLKQKSYLFA